jgi:N-acetylglucosamine-6-phosphate deacetylase
VLLRNARIVLPQEVAPYASLNIEDGRITRISYPQADEPANAESTIDLEGLTLFPGFIDIHIHGAVGVDAMEASADDLGRVASFLARHGVTAWLPTLVPSADEQYRRAIEAITEFITLESEVHSGSLSSGARALGVHYEGPFVNSEQCGALHREHFRTFDSLAGIEGLPTIKHQGAVHLMTLAPEIEGGIELIKELNHRGWIVSIGHTRATPDILDKASEAGARHMTHFMNAMSLLHQRAPGPVGWGLMRDDVSIDLIADGVHLDPLMLKVLLRCKTPARMSVISDAIAATGLGDGEYQIWGEQIVVKDGRTRNAQGNIAGSVATMLDAVRMMRSLGASDPELACMASLNPARLLGMEKECGSIEVGKRADLVALDEQGNAQLTFIGGRIAFDVSAETRTS